MHPSFDPATVRRRQLEFDRAENATAVGQLVQKWSREDAAAADAQDWRTREVAELRQRVAALERIIGPNGKRLVRGVAAATGDALAQIRIEERAHAAAELERRGFVSYRGTFDEGVAYERGSMVTHAGSTWIAVGPVEKGERPGRGASWRLASKGESSRAPGAA
jgi:hypothetical protein